MALQVKDFDPHVLVGRRGNGIASQLLRVAETLADGDVKGIKALDQAQAVPWRAIVGATVRRYLIAKFTTRIVADSEGCWLVVSRRIAKKA